MFSFGSFRNWLKLLCFNLGFDRLYTVRALSVSFHRFISILLRLCGRDRYGQVIKTTTIKEPPVFIIGHWRSGTTYLHKLICQDQKLAYMSLFQVAAPEFFLLNWKILRQVAAAFIPPIRPMDNVALSLDGPQEEEFAVANMSPYSFYHQWSFPRNARYYFEKYVLFHNASQECINQWKEIYINILRSATLNAGGKRVVTKNPVNTGRIGILLELFPDAKFIHIYRNPYLVFLSTQHLYNRMLAMFQLQEVSQEEIEANIFFFYKKLMKKFLAEKFLIPRENFIELRFEDVEANPLAEICRVYDSLALPGFKMAEPGFRTYISSQANYLKNTYDLNDEVVAKVNRNWQFTFDAWGYDPL